MKITWPGTGNVNGDKHFCDVMSLLTVHEAVAMGLGAQENPPKT